MIDTNVLSAMAMIGLRNRRLRDPQCTLRDSQSRDKVVHVVAWPRPSGLNVSIGISCLMQITPACTAKPHPTAHCPHRRKFRVIFENRDRGELGGGPLQGMFLRVYTCHIKP